MIHVEVNNVAFSNIGFVIFLREQDGERTLPIFIGPLEARAIATELNKEPSPRPMTHDLFRTVLSTVDCNIQRVEVCDLVDNTFYGKLIIEKNSETMEIDSRPSDAIALALRFSAPIYVDERVMDEAGTIIEEQTDTPPREEAPPKKGKLTLREHLQQELEKAIAEERYEDAAKLRDEIENITNTEGTN
ncbi:MAG: hypothetical protein GF398_15795 [Chitinivibrionales bacterium]|nr:hypothetical protein [Chitinivibrionales bacterium]